MASTTAPLFIGALTVFGERTHAWDSLRSKMESPRVLLLLLLLLALLGVAAAAAAAAALLFLIEGGDPQYRALANPLPFTPPPPPPPPPPPNPGMRQ